jgi:hypothetical protein
MNSEPEIEFVFKRPEFHRNVVTLKIREPVSNDEAWDFARKVSGESGCFGGRVIRRGDEVDVHFYTD